MKKSDTVSANQRVITRADSLVYNLATLLRASLRTPTQLRLPVRVKSPLSADVPAYARLIASPLLQGVSPAGR